MAKKHNANANTNEDFNNNIAPYFKYALVLLYLALISSPTKRSIKFILYKIFIDLYRCHTFIVRSFNLIKVLNKFPFNKLLINLINQYIMFINLIFI